MKLPQNKIYHVNSVITRTLTNISDIKFASEDKTLIECTVVFKEFPLEPMSFTADKWDSMAHGREMYNDILSGEFGPIAEYVAPEPVPEEVEETKPEVAPVDGGAA